MSDRDSGFVDMYTSDQRSNQWETSRQLDALLEKVPEVTQRLTREQIFDTSGSSSFPFGNPK